MTLGEIVELIFGFAVLAFMLLFVIVVPFQLLKESKTPRRRRSRRPSYASSRYKSFTPKDFDYYHHYDKSQFFVYFIENQDLNALKIGVGSGGRLLQLLNSYQEKNEESPNVGWKLLRLASFANFQNEYELGKIYGEQAEKRAHYYWRNVLKLPIHLNDLQMGYSKVKNYGDINWTLTKGYTETVEKSEVCEVSTWNYVINSYGFIEEQNEFMGNSPRELKLLYPDHSTLDQPENYEHFKPQKVRHYYEKEFAPRRKKSVEDRFWAKVTKRDDGCWIWEGSTLNDRYGYGVFAYNDKNQTAHRVAWQLVKRENIENLILDKICSTFKCVNPDHWGLSSRLKSIDGKKRVSEFTCITAGCANSSRTVTKAGVCEPCNQRAKRERRKIRKQSNQ